jgi:glucose/arabinose dehydrogenase
MFRIACAQTYRIDTLARAPYAQYPVCIAFPEHGDGLFFFTEKNSGKVRLYADALQTKPLLSIGVETDGAQGLLGITTHPSYPDTPYVYVFYIRAEDRLGIVERYRDSLGTGVDPLLLSIIPRRDGATENNGGILRFGTDGKLYVTVGDHYTHPELAQDTSSRHIPWGKILRLNPDGSYPHDNPSPGKPFWAFGLRNCVGLTVDNATGAMFCTDGGTGIPNRIFKVNRGNNFGWPLTLHPSSTHFARPLYEFPAEFAPDLTGIVVYRGDAFPNLRGKLLFTSAAIPAVWIGTLTEGGDSLHVEKLFAYTTGLADIQIGPDGCIYLTNGPYMSSKILRVSPVPPTFTSTPPSDAVQDIRYSYRPTFSGTPPDVTLLSGPDGMKFDRSTGLLTWTPSNAQALTHQQRFTLQARNGAGVATQQNVVSVINVNDPPSPFALTQPAPGQVISFFTREPELILRWRPSTDPDGDSVSHFVSIDTTASFDTGFLRNIDAGGADSARVLLPRTVQTYYWRVIATDGRFITVGTPSVSSFTVSVTTPPPIPLRAARETTPPATEQAEPAPLSRANLMTYALPRAGHVRLAVCNILGQEVLLVYDGVQSEGTHTVDLTKLNLQNGMYFYRLQGPGIFETKKMVLAR